MRATAARWREARARRPASLLRFVRAALAVALVALASGTPQVVSAALADDCCAERCPGELEGKGCPPDCTAGACAKVFPTAVAPASSVVAVPGGRAEPRTLAGAGPSLPLVLGGVFHPPRR